MRKTIEEFKSVIDEALPVFCELTEAESAAKPAPDKWSKKEIIGHLIDSASNNHQRFVRAQLSAELKLPGYDQETWVKTQEYVTEPWQSLVQLWSAYNRHLIHLVSAIPEGVFQHYCFIGENEPVTLEFLVRDYVRHLKHHVDQILG